MVLLTQLVEPCINSTTIVNFSIVFQGTCCHFFFHIVPLKKKNGNPRVRRHQPHAHESDHTPLRGYVRADQNERGMHRK